MKYIIIFTFFLLIHYYDEPNEKQHSSGSKQAYVVLDKKDKTADPILSIARDEFVYSKLNPISVNKIKILLKQHADTLSPDVINMAVKTIECAIDSKVAFNDKLIIIDYSLPTNKKRFWIFDLDQKKLLFHTYVSHGLKSGISETTYFSNINGSKASSIGIYHTGKPYIGRHGLSLKLDGLENGFNSNSRLRYIVMHSAWYVTDDFIQKYGRTGRSWGCPAIPLRLIHPVVDALSEQSLFIIYYPSKNWLSKSKFLNCKNSSIAKKVKNIKILESKPEDDQRGEILFIDKNNNNKREENEPILIIAADKYKLIFNANAPLTRMLRRQFHKKEHIALNIYELKKLDSNNDNLINKNDNPGLSVIDFVVPSVKKIRGYYATEFESVNLGVIKEINIKEDNREVSTNKTSLKVRASGKFIRWLGL